MRCPSKTRFLENKKAQPIPAVFGFFFEGSEKDLILTSFHHRNGFGLFIFEKTCVAGTP